MIRKPQQLALELRDRLRWEGAAKAPVADAGLIRAIPTGFGRRSRRASRATSR